MLNFGAGVFPATAGTDVVTAVTGQITDNIGPVLVVLGAMVGLGIVFRLFRKATHGKI